MAKTHCLPVCNEARGALDDFKARVYGCLEALNGYEDSRFLGSDAVEQIRELFARDVPPAMVEAATSAGSTMWQLIAKVQLPAARNALLLAANQGLIFVLAVIVIGGDGTLTFTRKIDVDTAKGTQFWSGMVTLA